MSRPKAPTPPPTGECAVCRRANVEQVHDWLCCTTCWSTVPVDLQHALQRAEHLVGRYSNAVNHERLDQARKDVLEAIR